MSTAKSKKPIKKPAAPKSPDLGKLFKAKHPEEQALEDKIKKNINRHYLGD